MYEILSNYLDFTDVYSTEVFNIHNNKILIIYNILSLLLLNFYNIMPNDKRFQF